MIVHEPHPRIDDTLNVLADLAKCSPRRAKDRRTNLEAAADTFANWSMAFAVLALVASWLVALVLSRLDALTATGKLAVLIIVTASTILAVLALLAPIAATALTLLRWKKIALTNLQDDIRHEQAMVDTLTQYAESALTDARYWLELKIKRLDSRVSYFFGEKTAQLTLLATSYLFAKEFGGFKWLSETFAAGTQSSNIGNNSLMLIAAGLLGLSIGAVLIKHMAARYRYQVELIERALK